MAYLQLSEGRLAFGARTIFQDTHLRINSGDRLALAGANGSGKTTLMKALAGEQELDGGTLSASRGARTAYLPQSGIAQPSRPVRQLALQAFSFLDQINGEADSIGRQLEGNNLTEKQTSRLVEEHHRLQERLLEDGYHDRDRRTEEVLLGLGFRPGDLDRPADTFSGGWQMRIALARILLSDPDILLLDEPTNYLDLEARDWLFQFISRFRGGLLIVSHDRWFLDRTISGVLELFQGRLCRFQGNYSRYEVLRREENERLAQAYEQQQEEIRRIEEFISKFRYNASKAPQVQSRVKMLEKMERVAPPPGMSAMNLSFPPPPHSGREVLRLKGLGKAYGQTAVLRDLTMTVNRGEKMVVTGLNGAGKSTLLRILAGADRDYRGTLEWGTGVDLGYFSQDHEKALPANQSLLDFFEDAAPTELVPRVRDMLGALLFTGDDVYKKLGVLSGGEKSRVSLLKILLEPHNLLILDEPTNHLDIHSKDVLLQALRDYRGTVIFVSHDRYFIEGLAGRVLEILPAGEIPEAGQGAISNGREYPGSYAYYLSQKERQAGSESEAPSPLPANRNRAGGAGGKTPQPPSGAAAEASSRKQSHQEAKRQRNTLRKLERRSEQLMEEQEAAEEELRESREKLTRPEIYSDPAKAGETEKEIREAEAKVNRLSEAWMETEEELEGLRGPES